MDLPANPTIGDTYTLGSRQWEWDGIVWNAVLNADIPVVPAASVMMYAALIAPLGWAFCDGTIYNVVDFPETAALLGSTYGGDGVTTFGVPNTKGRFPIGIDPAQTPFDSLGETGGSRNATLVSHTHTGTAASSSHSHTGSTSSDSHSHNVSGVPTGSAGATSGTNVNARIGTGNPSSDSDSHSHTVTINADSHNHTVTVDAAGNSATDANLPPYLTFNYIIKMT